MNPEQKRKRSSEANVPKPLEESPASPVSMSLEELLSAGDEIINRTLSTDSQSFLNQMRQEGGQ